MSSTKMNLLVGVSVLLSVFSTAATAYACALAASVSGSWIIVGTLLAAMLQSILLLLLVRWLNLNLTHATFGEVPGGPKGATRAPDMIWPKQK